MELKPGYRQTEAGVIPADWKAVHLGDLLASPPTYGINAPAIPFDSRYPTYLRITDISEDGRFNEESKASVKHALAATYLLSDSDLVFARTGASVGKSYLYDPHDGELVFAGFLIRIRPDPKKLEPAYLRYFAVRPEGAFHQWREVPPRELSIALVADERFGRATGWIEAS